MSAMSQPQVIPKRKKKFTGGNASKRHRDRVNVEFTNLAKLLPFPENVIAKLDKSSILRLAVSYIRAKSFFKDTLDLKNLANPFRSKTKLTKEEKLLTEEIFEGHGLVAEIFLQALDGFLIVVTEDMKVLYVSDSVRDYLGYCQAGIIHESLLQFVHTTDHDIIREGLALGNETLASYESDMERDGSLSLAESDDISLKQEDSSSCDSKEKVEFDGEKLVERRRFICRMKCALSCSSRFYTAFRSFQFAGHVRKSKIKIGKEKKTVNTLIAFCTPTGSSNYDAIDFMSDGVEDVKGQDLEEMDELAEGLPKMSGLHIEPRLRPHVAPIPVTQNESDRRMNGHNYTIMQNGPKDPYRRTNGQFKDTDYLNGSMWPRLNGHNPCGDYFRAAMHEYNPETRRLSPTWNSKSPSSSGRSTPDSENGKCVKRPRNEKGGPPDYISAKYAKLYDPSHYVLGPQKPVAIDDINRGAILLLGLSNSRKRYLRPGHYPSSGLGLETQSRSSELALLANRLNGCIPSVMPGSYHEPRVREYSVIRSTTQPDSETSGSAPTSPKKEDRKSFHISNILGLDDDKPVSPGHEPTESVRGADAQVHSPSSRGQPSPVSREHSPLSCISSSKASDNFRRQLDALCSRSRHDILGGHTSIWKNGDRAFFMDEARHRCGLSREETRKPDERDESERRGKPEQSHSIDNIDDIKHSFAKILSGLTTTITSNLDKTINTVFQSSTDPLLKEAKKDETRSMSSDTPINVLDRQESHRVIIKGMS